MVDVRVRVTLDHRGVENGVAAAGCDAVRDKAQHRLHACVPVGRNTRVTVEKQEGGDLASEVPSGSEAVAVCQIRG